MASGLKINISAKQRYRKQKNKKKKKRNEIYTFKSVKNDLYILLLYIILYSTEQYDRA